MGRSQKGYVYKHQPEAHHLTALLLIVVCNVIRWHDR